MSERRDRIRAAIVDWDRGSSKGQRWGEFVYVLSERERDELADRIEEVLSPSEPAREEP